ncbi:dihydrodipicolinate reductase [Allonocardiopsis opalescens]|uniref:Uncharacterized protein n=1 Tax=Allonocardiopsis opalescens TaxID=1144618 RepID=A0A2T0QDZ8_9ACTN|nr:dihydrodipicolinate reductase [Allonocardiopsis opalescens]PRY02073.1 hypothetical protein CLV72_101673 [Allonocardiopsis opalescens]
MTIRVVQWATGTVGRAALRALLARPGFEVVGVYAHQPDKAGRDAGELAGMAPVGVRATGDIEEILALPADCVAHMPLPAAYFGDDPDHDTKTICRLLASGKNVVTTTGFTHPYSYGPELVSRLENACRVGDSSLHGTGISPGFLTQLLPFALSTMSMRIDHIYLRDCSDYAGHPSRQIVVDLMGFSRDAEAYAAAVRPFRAFHRQLYTESLDLLARALGVELHDVEEDDEVVEAAQDYTVAAGPIPKGTVCGSRWQFTGIVHGRPLISMECVYKADAGRLSRWGTPGFTVRVEGRPSFMAKVEELDYGMLAAAAHAVNAIPALVAAPAGIRTFLDLPLTGGTGTIRVG